ncbi:MAG: OmpA family protein [Propylenella sp.]
MMLVLFRAGAAALVLGASAILFQAAAFAQTAEELIEALAARKVRAAGVDAEAKRTQGLIESLRGRTARLISVEERTEVAEIARESELPQIDLEVLFEFNSADIAQAALPALVALGQALTDDRLEEAVFLIAGHTDAKGSAEYNQGLSERRAEAVKDFLVATFKLDPTALIAIGYGKEQLKLPDDPLSGENRRVQVVNLAEK